MDYILGSGLIAYIAKQVFPDYKIIPLGKSRFFQYEVSTCDDYIFCHDAVDSFMKEVSPTVGMSCVPVFFKRALSYNGQIIFNKNEVFLGSWINKVYNGKHNPNTQRLIKFDSFVYNIAGTDLFKALENKHKSDFREFIMGGESLKHIDTENRVIYTTNNQFEYDNIINTVPLSAMVKFCGTDMSLNSSDLHTFVIETDELDFEGASELLVVDDNIDFHKCTRIGRNIYQFFAMREIKDLARYVGDIVKKYNILSATVVRNAIPLGNHNAHKKMEKYGITSVGGCAQHDDMMDISSCINRLINIRKKQ